MGFRNNRTGYPDGLLQSRALLKKGDYALLPLEGLVRNAVPGFDGCDLTILSSPKMGATFVDYYVTVHPEGKTTTGFGGNGVETLVYVLEGKIEAKAGNETAILEQGGYMFCPPSLELNFKNVGSEKAELFLYKRRYKSVLGIAEPPVVTNHVKNLTAQDYEGMANLKVYNFLPTDNLSFDMNFHILEFAAGASHGYIETHVQEHGAYIYSGKGVYNLDNEWVPVEKGDYIFMGSYVHQAAYGVSTDEPFAYVYSKDCNRDEEI